MAGSVTECKTYKNNKKLNGREEVERIIIVITKSSVCVYAAKIVRQYIENRRNACNPEHRTLTRMCSYVCRICASLN